MRHIPPLHLILAFEAVARLGSFNQAADELNVSKSSISHRIRELERLVGATLFERTTRRVALSQEGLALHRTISGPLNMLDDAFSALAPRRSVVRISVLPSFARFRLLPELKEFKEARPDIALEISSTTRTVNVDQGDADIALRFSAIRPSAHHCELLLADEWFPVAAPSYLRKLGNPRLQQLFKTAEFLSHTRQPWDSWLAKAGVKISAEQRTLTYSDTGFMLDAALSEQGVALVRRSLVKQLLNHSSLMRVSDVSIPAEQSYYMLASERALISNHCGAVMAWIRSLVSNG